MNKYRCLNIFKNIMTCDDAIIPKIQMYDKTVAKIILKFLNI